MDSRVTFSLTGTTVVIRTTIVDPNGGVKIAENSITITQETADAARSGQLTEDDLLRQIRAQWQVIDEAHTASIEGAMLGLTGTRDEVRNYINGL